MSERRNINRGYMKLLVWQDAKTYYVLSCGAFRTFPYELKRVASQQIASVDSIHRNIAEGYSFQEKQESGGWQDSFVVRESNAVYTSEAT